jgi:hypothetical protein
MVDPHDCGVIYKKAIKLRKKVANYNYIDILIFNQSETIDHAATFPG